MRRRSTVSVVGLSYSTSTPTSSQEAVSKLTIGYTGPDGLHRKAVELVPFWWIVASMNGFSAALVLVNTKIGLCLNASPNSLSFLALNILPAKRAVIRRTLTRDS